MKKPILRTELVLASYNKKICEKERFSASSRQDDGEGEQQGHEEHVAAGEAEDLVEGATLTDAEHLLPGADVERGVDEDHGHGGDAGREAEGIAQGEEQQDEQGDQNAYPEIVLAAETLAKADDEGALATDAVLIAIAIVVDDEQSVDGYATDEAQQEDAKVEREGLQVIGAAHGDKAEEEEHQQVAPAKVGEAGGVEEGEEDAEQAEGDELKASIRHLLPADGQCYQPHKAGEDDGDGYAPTHGVRSDPALRTGSLRAETVVAVGAFEVVVEVVDEVGGHLHACREQDAAEGGGDVGEHALTEGPGEGQDDGDEGAGQRLGTRGQQPGLGGISLDHG